MKTEIKEILDELYELDISLKEKESELVSIISKMIESKPNIAIDNNFKAELKSKILSQMNNKSNKFLNINALKYFLTFLSGIAVLTLFLNIYPNIFSWNVDKIATIDDLNISFAPHIEKLDMDNAFWKLSFSEGEWKTMEWWWVSKWMTNNTTMSVEWNSIEVKSPMLDKRMNILPVDNWLTKIEDPSDLMPVVPYPDYTQKLYIYKLRVWEKLPEIPKSMYVYKNKNFSINTVNANLSEIFKTDIIDFSKIKKLWLLNLSVYEDINDWYQFDISLSEWIVNINRNYLKWPEIDYSSQRELADLPNDDTILKIVNNFVNKYSINVSSFFKPIVNNVWKNEYESNTNIENFYVPDILSVLFQFNIDWIWVHEIYGNPYWLEATVNARDMKVNSFWPIQKLDLAWSKYDLITDNSKILELAKKWPYNNSYLDSPVSIEKKRASPEIIWNNWSVGFSEWNAWSADVSIWSAWSLGVSGWNAWMAMPAQPIENPSIKYEEVQVEIWNAKIVYLRKYVYNSETNTTDQYFVPWILFKVLTKNDDVKMIYPWEYITVPLVKDFLNTDNVWVKAY